MKKLVILFLIALLVSTTSALRINEVELNPAGTDKGAEWLELFSEQETDLKNHKLVNADGDEFELNEKFSGYLIIEFENQWLDNEDEKVFLYKNSELIDETDLFFDSANNDKTYQFCGNEWKFAGATKGKENNCGQESDSDKESEEQDEDSEEKSETQQDNLENKQPENKEKSDNESKNQTIKLNSPTGNAINLNPETENSRPEDSIIYESKNEKIKKYAIYAFCFFLIFVIVVLLLKK